MNFIKKLLAHPLAKKFLSGKALKTLLIALTGVGLIIIIVKWYRKRKETLAKEQAELKKLLPSSLTRVWKAFIGRIPGEFRHAIMLYQPVVVLGEAGSGKTLLIEKYTDWKGQSYQFYPSYTENPNFQIYLGSQVLSQEIAATVLNDTSREARIALTELWASSFKNRKPIIIVALKADSMNTITPDSLKRQAQMIRGKLNIISETQKELEIRIVLTHMDKLDGFSDFSKFLQAQNVPLKISLKGMNIGNDLKNCLEPYEAYLSLALTTLKAWEYKAIIRFLQDSPNMLNSVALFLQTLTERDPLTPSPMLEELYLVSNTSPQKLSNPFETAWPAEIVAMMESKRNKHRFLRNAIMILISALFIFMFLYEKNQWEKAQAYLASFHESPSEDLCKKVQNVISRITDKEKNKFRIYWHAFSLNRKEALQEEFGVGVRNFYRSEWNKTQKQIAGFEKASANIVRASNFEKAPSEQLYHEMSKSVEELVKLNDDPVLAPHLAESSMKQEKEIKAQLLSAIRNCYLEPFLEKCARSTNPHEKTIYLLSVIYASNASTNYLGKQTLENLSEWSKNLDIPEDVIKDYVTYSDTAWDQPVPLVEIPKSKKEMDPADMPDPWVSYFIEIEKCMDRPSITRRYLERIREEGKPLVEVIYYVGQYSLAQNLFNALDRETRVNIRKIYTPLEMTDWIAKNNKELKAFFQLIDSYPIEIPPSEKNKSLPQAINNLRTAMELAAPNKAFEFVLSGKTARTFKFSSEKWHQLIQKSKMTLIIENFISQNQDDQDTILFSGRNVFDPIEMNIYNDGTNIFRGKKKVEGRYTKDAYEKDIKSILQDFAELLKTLPVAKRKRDEFSNFVFERTRKYAMEYRRSYEDYYRGFEINADSTVSLSIVLSQMQLPAAAFLDLLHTVAENTALEIPDSPHFAPLQEQLGMFKPIQRLMLNKDNVELQNYKTILEEIREYLKEMPIKKEEKKEQTKPTEENFQQFSAMLAPVGRLALPILLQEKDSYLLATKNWLKSVGIAGELQKPFLAPIYALYDLGLANIDKTVQSNWDNRVFPIISDMLMKYPFNDKSERDITSIELEALIHPTSGNFWKVYGELIAPVCIRRGDTWQIRDSFRDPINLPYRVLAITNHLLWLSKVLWDKDGNPKPLVFTMRGHPLPPFQYYGKHATLACLTVGNSSVFNFNQQPTWQSFSVIWWKQEASKVIMEYTNKETKEKLEYSIAINDCLWSFFKLLQKAKVLEKEVWTWNLPENASDYIASKVKYSIQGNPWKYFQVIPLTTEYPDY